LRWGCWDIEDYEYGAIGGHLRCRQGRLEGNSIGERMGHWLMAFRPWMKRCVGEESVANASQKHVRSRSSRSEFEGTERQQYATECLVTRHGSSHFDKLSTGSCTIGMAGEEWEEVVILSLMRTRGPVGVGKISLRCLSGIWLMSTAVEAVMVVRCVGGG
jgi:hypothetical protein